jgi:hypothetical protein
LNTQKEKQATTQKKFITFILRVQNVQRNTARTMLCF